MAVFGGLVLTNAGRNLEAKHISGKELKFKKVALGDGTLGNSESMLTLENLKNEILDLGIKKIETVQDNIVKITFMLSNVEIPEGFYWREIGIIAEDPDTKEDVLYCYGNARENGEYISAGGETDILEKYVNIDLVISNTENISAVIDGSLIYITQKELEKELETIDNEIKLLYKKITLQTAGWKESGENYEYDVKDSNVTEKHCINGNMDLVNQEKMSDGYIESYDGGYKIITSYLPDEDIEMTITIQKAFEEVAV